MARDEYDCKLNGVGYMLAKTSDGDFLAGSAWSQAQDPFTQYISQEERWKRVSFGFRDGAGALKYDGTPRYAWGYNIDSRSGYVMNAPDCDLVGDGSADGITVAIGATVGDWPISTAGDEGVGVKVVLENLDYRTVILLLKRDEGVDYSAAAAFTVEIRNDAAGTPGAVVAGLTTTHSLKISEQEQWLHYNNRWEAAEYFWLEIHFPAAVNLAGGNYWICVTNNQAAKLNWGKHASSTVKVSLYNGAAWGAGSDQLYPYFTIAPHEDPDAFTRDFCTFQGSDDTKRLYAAVGPKVMYRKDITTPRYHGWGNSKGDFADKVTELIVYDDILFAAQGSTTAFYYSTGASATGVWAVHTDGLSATCWAIHDQMLWKGGGSTVRGATDAIGAGGWGSLLKVGDPGTPICRLSSHGGELYASKPEGLFEISYADTYPGSGTPTANMVLDFRSDYAARPFLVEWHSGLYFPGSGGGSVYEWKSGTLRDIWRERFTDGQDESLLPLYDEQQGRMLSATGTTRELLLTMASPFIGDSPAFFWAWDGRSWHPIDRSYREADTRMAILVESRGEGRGWLYFGEGPQIGGCYWPTWTDDRSNDPLSHFQDADLDYYRPHLVLSEFDDGRPELLKDWYRLTLRTYNTGVALGGHLDVEYSIDNGTWTALGAFNTSPSQSIDFPTNTTGYKIQIRMEWDNPSTTKPLRLESVDLLFQPLPDTITQHRIGILAAKNIEKNNNAIDERSAGTIYAALDALLEETEPWTYTDELGVDHTVRATSVSKESSRRVEADSGDGTGFRVEATVQVTMLEV